MSQSFKREMTATIQQRQANAARIIDKILSTYRNSDQADPIFKAHSSTYQLFLITKNDVLALNLILHKIEELENEIEKNEISNDQKQSKKKLLSDLKSQIMIMRARDQEHRSIGVKLFPSNNEALSGQFEQILKEELDALIKRQEAEAARVRSVSLRVDNSKEKDTSIHSDSEVFPNSTSSEKNHTKSGRSSRAEIDPYHASLIKARLLKKDRLVNIDSNFKVTETINIELKNLISDLLKLTDDEIANILLNSEAVTKSTLISQALLTIQKIYADKTEKNVYKRIETEVLALIAEDILLQLTENMNKIQARGHKDFYNALSNLKVKLKADILEQLQMGKTRDQITKNSDAGYILYQTCNMTNNFIDGTNARARKNAVKKYKKALQPFSKCEKFGVVIALVIGAALGAAVGAILGYGVGAIPGALIGTAIVASAFGCGAGVGVGVALAFRFFPPNKKYQALHKEVVKEAKHAAETDTKSVSTSPTMAFDPMA